MIADIPVGGEQMGMLSTMYYNLTGWSFNNVEQTSDGGQASVRPRDGDVGLVIIDRNMAPMTGLEMRGAARMPSS